MGARENETRTAVGIRRIPGVLEAPSGCCSLPCAGGWPLQGLWRNGREAGDSTRALEPRLLLADSRPRVGSVSRRHIIRLLRDGAVRKYCTPYGVLRTLVGKGTRIWLVATTCSGAPGAVLAVAG